MQSVISPVKERRKDGPVLPKMTSQCSHGLSIPDVLAMLATPPTALVDQSHASCRIASHILQMPQAADLEADATCGELNPPSRARGSGVTSGTKHGGGELELLS